MKTNNGLNKHVKLVLISQKSMWKLGCNSVVEHLPSMGTVMVLISSTAKKTSINVYVY
jgi:hypothetical protein